MLFVTVGNHDQPFDRLIAAIDGFCEKLEMETVMQTGVGKFSPRHATAQGYYPLAEAEEFFKKADAVVAHAGIGTIITARKSQTPLIICPRRESYGEHFNDHQLEICEELLLHPRQGVEVAMEPSDIEPILAKILSGEISAKGSGGVERPLELEKALRDFLKTI